jgi:alpha-beta hydrolase superfamily lysophospholipase
MSRPVRVALGVLLLPVLYLLVTLIMAFDWSRRSRPWHLEVPPPDEQTEQIWLHTPDGQKLGAWVRPPQGQHDVVILLHGKDGSRSSLWSVHRYEHLAHLGLGVLALSLRTYGDSTGTVRDFQHFPLDVVTAVDYVRQRFAGHAVKIMGPSLGAGVALMAAPDLGTGCAGYLLEVPFKDLVTSEQHHYQAELPGPLAALAWRGLDLWAPCFVPRGLEGVNPWQAAASIPSSVPVVLIAGDADEQAQLWEAQAILSQVQSHGKLVIIHGADHHHCMEADPNLYWKTVDEWALNKT